MIVPLSLLPLEPFPTAPDTHAFTPYIRLHDLGKRYPGRVQALQEIDLGIRRSGVFGIIGRSDTGKSPLTRTLNCLERPSEGQVLIDDEDIGGYDGQRLVALRRRIGMIFQHFNLVSVKTAWRNIALPLRMAGAPRARIEERIAGLLQLIGLEEERDAYPAQLSDRQKQCVDIARMLMYQPQILPCDEVTSALDPESIQTILALLHDINRRLGLTIVLITHEMTVIRETCGRAVVLECGRIVGQGEVWEVFGDPRHVVTRDLFGSLRVVLPADSQTRLRQTSGAGDLVLLDFRYTGASQRVPDLLAIIRAIGQRVNLLHGDVEWIQGRALGCLLLQAGTPSGKLLGVLAKAVLVVDRVEVFGHVAHA